MSSTTQVATHPHGVQLVFRRGVTGALAGIGGGIVFGMLMAMMGMLPMIAALIGASSEAVGMLVHLIISAGIGALFGVLWPARRLGSLLVAGAVYGVIWWVLGGLVIMPARLGMPVFAINATAMMSLMGHLIYGMVTGVALWLIRRRTESA